MEKYIKNILERYCLNNTQENINPHFNNLLASKQSFISRKNSFGHITASAVVLDSTLSKILLVHHKNLEKFIQPGGHIDETDVTFSQAAARELAEETGFTHILPVSFSANHLDIPVDIDIHAIPENKKKQEPEHLHFDFRYVFVLLETHKGEICEEEIGSIVWKPLRDFEQSTPDLARIAQKVRDLISERQDEIFFGRMKRIFPQSKNANIVIVSHIVPDVLPFIQTLTAIAEKVSVIPKQNSISSTVLSLIPKNIIHSLSREQLQNEQILQKLFPSDMKNYVVDIGGYFATKEFFDFCNKEKRVVGVIEDTENGFVKYKKLGDLVTLPVFSVARSELKHNEDDLVGYSVAYYAEMITRKNHLLPRYLTVGIIGYGKLGKGIAKYLFNQNIKPIVCDINPIRIVEAYKDGCIVKNKEELLSSAQLIFGATGSQSITGDEFSVIRPGCYIASVTSSEDEFGFDKLIRGTEATNEGNFVERIDYKNTHFYLINSGNAINFIDRDGDRVGNFIRLVQGEIMQALAFLMRDTQSKGFLEVPDEDRRSVARVFIENYALLN